MRGASTYDLQTICRGGHFLRKNGAQFDAPFFALSKSEVMSMDPQQRIVMENVYEALENGELHTAT